MASFVPFRDLVLRATCCHVACLQEKTTLKLDFAAEGIHGGALIGVRTNEFVVFYDWDVSWECTRVCALEEYLPFAHHHRTSFSMIMFSWHAKQINWALLPCWPAKQINWTFYPAGLPSKSTGRFYPPHALSYPLAHQGLLRSHAFCAPFPCHNPPSRPPTLHATPKRRATLFVV
jgi:hypothetical protein